MKDCRAKGMWLLIVLLAAVSSIVLMASQETQIKIQTRTKESLKFFPHTYDQCPELPSPYTMKDGTEILVGITKDNKFTLIPVTVEKGESLGYREKDWDKIRILEIDGEDFPTLARTGLHSEIELDCTRRITGRSIAEITDSGRPEGSSGWGFMGQDEDIISVLKGDNRLAKKLGPTHPQLARPLFHVWNIARWISYTSRSVGRSIGGIDYFLYNKRKVRLISAGGRGWQSSIFNDEILGMYHLEFSIELTEDEKAFLQEKYSNLSDEQMAGFQKMLSRIHTGEMVPFYIMRYGFYEGHTGYRADPIAISFIFGLRSLEEIEKAFEGNLYKALTEHFTRENISAGGGRYEE
ncbi:MAG: hypothetical protein KAV87_36445 [Desulfobacteraceae bacterium]|nr:hypothetical protein [Desulfobacteraceae bacterium]